MRIAGHTLGTPDHTVEEALGLFARAGLDAAEVIYQDDYRSALPLGDMQAARRARLVGEDHGVPIVGVTPYTKEINSLSEAKRRGAVGELLGAIDVAAVVGADRVRIYAGQWQPGSDNHAGHWDALLTSLRELAAHARQAGVRLCVENHFGTMTQSAKETAALVHELDDSAVRALYDQANLTFTHCEQYDQALEIQAGIIAHVHVKDLVFTDPDAPFRAAATERVLAEERAVRSRVVGQGVLPWREILAGLTAGGYDDVVSLEYEYRWHRQDLPAPEIGFRESAQVLRSYLSAIAHTEV